MATEKTSVTASKVVFIVFLGITATIAILNAHGLMVDGRNIQMCIDAGGYPLVGRYHRLIGCIDPRMIVDFRALLQS